MATAKTGRIADKPVGRQGTLLTTCSIKPCVEVEANTILSSCQQIVLSAN